MLNYCIKPHFQHDDMLKILGFWADSIQCIVCEESKRIIDTLPLVIYWYIWFSHLCRLENYPQFLMLLFIGGLQYPVSHMVLLSLFLVKKIVNSVFRMEEIALDNATFLTIEKCHIYVYNLKYRFA